MTPLRGTIEERANGATNAFRPLTHPLDSTEKGAAAMIRRTQPDTCTSPVCDRPTRSRGMCQAHYMRSTGPAKNARLDEPIRLRLDGSPEAFWARVIKTDTCWLWSGAHRSAGYGTGRINGRTEQCHVIAYELTYGPVPEGMFLDHFVCSNPPCCNPDHVRPVTPRENVLRSHTSVPALNRAKTHCKNGHAFVGYNVMIRTSDGTRGCRACYQQRAREAHRRRVESRPAVTFCARGHEYGYKIDGRRICRPCEAISREARKRLGAS